jgi:hypothetical protein
MKLTRPKEDQNLWNFIFSLFFFVALVAAMWEVWGETGTFPHAVPIFDAILMALAAFRLTRLIVYDKIARWFRELFVHRRTYIENGVAMVELTPRASGFARTVSDLLACPWCIGFWSALIIAFCYFMYPWAWFVIFFLALAGAGSFIQIAANLVGWKAEQLKKTVEQL